MSTKLLIKSSFSRHNINYLPQTINTNKSTIEQNKHSSIENYRNPIKTNPKFSHSTSFTSMSTTLFSKKHNSISPLPKHSSSIVINKKPSKCETQFKPINPYIQKEMRKVKMKIRKLILNHQKQQPCDNFENHNYENNKKIKDFFANDQRIKAIQKYKSKFHFGQVNYNFIYEPLKRLIDITKYQRGSFGINDLYEKLTTHEKEIFSLEPSYFVNEQTFLMKKVKTKSLTQKLNEEEKEEEKLQKQKIKETNNYNDYKSNTTNTKYQTKYTNTCSDISQNYFLFNKYNETLTPFLSPIYSKGSFLEKMKSQMVKDLHEKMKEYENKHKEIKDDDYHNFNKANFAKTMIHFHNKLYNLRTNRKKLKKKERSFYRKKSISYVNELKMNETKGSLLKSNSVRIIFEKNHRERIKQLQVQNNNKKDMKSYLNNIKQNISKKEND